MRRLILLTACFAVLSGCAGTPNVDYQYYLTKSMTTITVTQSLACNAAGTSLFTTEIPAVATTYSADYDNGPYSIPIANLDNPLADADIGIKRTDDGRLLSINQTTTGEAGAVVKSALSLAAAVFTAGGGETGVAPSSVTSDCATLKKLGGGKPVSLIYAADIPLGQQTSPTNIVLSSSNVNDPATLSAFDVAALPALSIHIGAPVQLTSGASEKNISESSEVPLTLQQQLSFPISFRKITPAATKIYATDYVEVPNEARGATYILPIPKAAYFGSENFALTLNDSGAITSIEYGKHSGASSALDSTTGVVTTASDAQTNALTAQTAGLKAQDAATAEAIAHAQCLAMSSTCK